MTNHELLQGVALGCAMGNRTLLARMLEQMDDNCFERGPARLLWQAIASEDKEEVTRFLTTIGVTVGENGCAAAVLTHLQQLAAKRRQRLLADQLQAAATLLSPDDFERFIEAKLAEIRQHKPVTQEIAGKILGSA